MSVTTWPYVPCYHRTPGSNMVPTRVVIHGTVTPCDLGVAMNVARGFQDPASGGSAHKVVDPAQVVVCATDDVICWHAPPNTRSLGIELCDPVAGDPARWQDTRHQAMLRLAATEVRNWCGLYGIPVVKIGPADLVRGARGICGHVDVSQAWHETDHYDPGPGFPWPQFLAMVRGDPQEDDMATYADQLNRIELYAAAGSIRSGWVQSWLTDDAIHAAIEEIYQELLGRKADTGGLAAWTAAARAGATRDQVRARVAATAEAKAYAAKKPAKAKS